MKNAKSTPDISNAHINAMDAEAHRLLDYCMEQTSALQQHGILDECFKESLENLKNEKQKLRNREAVIAVVGTMKAGKSTTINAMVGKEVLPNRNAPMTAVPTLIRHTAGQTEPELKIQKPEPLLDLIKQIQKQLHQSSKDNTDTAFSETAEFAKKFTEFKEVYKGEQEIFTILKSINDLVRLCNHLPEIKFPFDAYRNIDDLPLIEVEFVHMQGSSDAGGLCLLDTPGPNEAGQNTHMQKMMSEQLDRASTVICVLDYTQLNSEADARVRDEVQKYFNDNTDNIFALVNKFDQKDGNSMAEMEVKRHVKHKLSGKEEMNEDNIFPVSSRLAFLAEMGRQCSLDIKPSANAGVEQNNWIADFKLEAFGRTASNKELSSEKLQEGVEILWEASGLKKPLAKIIQSGMQSGHKQSIASACRQVTTLSQSSIQFIEGRLQALQSDQQSAEVFISDLDNRIKNVIDLMVYIDIEKEEIPKEFKRKISEIIERGKNNSKEEILSELNKHIPRDTLHIRALGTPGILGNLLTKDKKESMHSRKDKKEIIQIITLITDMAKNKLSNKLHESEKEINIIANEFNKKINSISSEIEDKLNSLVDASIGDSLTRSITMLKPMLEKYEQKNKPTEKLIEEQSKSYLTEDDGMVSWVKRRFDYFGQEWGYRRVKYKDHTIKKDKLESEFKNIIDDCYCDMQSKIEEKIFKDLNQCSDDMQFIIKELRSIKAGYESGIKQKQENQEKTQKNSSDLKKFISTFDTLLNDSRSLEKSITG